MKHLYGAFTKLSKNDDGTIEVEGIASTEAVDSDGDIIKADAMRAAIPGYMKFGTIREMHGDTAAGTALSCEVNSAGQTVLRARVVDPVSVKKVLAGVLKGFSIGGTAVVRDKIRKAVITAFELIEISLVDRPANPDAVITLYKARLESRTTEDSNGRILKALGLQNGSAGMTRGMQDFKALGGSAQQQPSRVDTGGEGLFAAVGHIGNTALPSMEKTIGGKHYSTATAKPLAKVGTTVLYQDVHDGALFFATTQIVKANGMSYSSRSIKPATPKQAMDWGEAAHVAGTLRSALEVA